MAEEIINNGTSPGDFTGEGLYYAFGKVKRMFSELYQKFVASDAILGTHTSQIGALQGGQTSLAGQITAINNQMTDGIVTFRYRTVAGILYMDRTTTALGFGGVEGNDWVNINEYQ
jgi:hypothetical protein